MAKNAGRNVVTAWCFGGGDVVHGSLIFARLKMCHVSAFNFLFFHHGMT
jgi:hypothetical protein